MANQFSRRGPPDRIKKNHDEASKDKMRAEKLAQRLYKYASSKGERAKKYAMEATQVQAAKVLIDRGKPVLQAIEQKIVDELPSETEIMAQLHALLANPGTRAQIQAMLAGSPKPVTDTESSSESVVDQQQTGT
jgi:vacuolar-type H+-ATPase subunit E/Vma4